MKSRIATVASFAGAALMLASAVALADQSTDARNKEWDRMNTDMDTNKDGMISRAEYADYHGRRFDSWDTSRKGMLTRDEMKSRAFDRELRKTDGNFQGNSSKPGSVQK